MPVTGGSQYSQYLLNEQMSRPKSIERLQIWPKLKDSWGEGDPQVSPLIKMHIPREAKDVLEVTWFLQIRVFQNEHALITLRF